MYAIIKTGGKNYRVKKGTTLKIQKLNNKLGDKVVFDEVLLVADEKNTTIGTPNVKNATVDAVIKKHGRERKIAIIKFRRRKHSMKRQGHRQDFTQIEINEINT